MLQPSRRSSQPGRVNCSMQATQTSPGVWRVPQTGVGKQGINVPLQPSVTARVKTAGTQDPLQLQQVPQEPQTAQLRELCEPWPC
jgi:hypothetical protein